MRLLYFIPPSVVMKGGRRKRTTFILPGVFKGKEAEFVNYTPGPTRGRMKNTKLIPLGVFESINKLRMFYLIALKIFL